MSIPQHPDGTVPIISVRGVSKHYKLYPSHKERLKEALHPFRKRYHEEFQALSDISFDIRRGQNVGILGRNGAGKSTLLQLIAGVLTPSAGTIAVTGRVSALLELGAGFNPDLTGRENVILSSTISGLPEEGMDERVAAVEAFADIGVFFDQPMKIYSSGMFARVAFANAIHVNPDVLIVDEILGVGDAKFQEKCYSRIRELRDQGVSILFVSHSTEVIQRNCETALLLEAGRLVRQGPADEVVAAYQDMLYGARLHVDVVAPVTTSAAGTEQENGTGGQAFELEAFIENTADPAYMRFPHYNPYERRLGNGAAEIVDFAITADGSARFTALEGAEALSVYLKVRFIKEIALPQVGWALVSPEGIVIAGSNTVMQKTVLPSAAAGDVFIYQVKLAPRLCGGQYFLNFGVFEQRGDDWEYLDVRRSAIHFSVFDSGVATGFFEMPSSCTAVGRQ